MLHSRQVANSPSSKKTYCARPICPNGCLCWAQGRWSAFAGHCSCEAQLCSFFVSSIHKPPNSRSSRASCALGLVSTSLYACMYACMCVYVCNLVNPASESELGQDLIAAMAVDVVCQLEAEGQIAGSICPDAGRCWAARPVICGPLLFRRSAMYLFR